MDTKIEKLTTIDAQNAAEIANLAQQLGYESRPAELLVRVNLILKSNLDQIFVARDLNEIIGWVQATNCIRVESPTFVEITGLIVDQRFRKQQIGKQLIESAINWAHDLRIYHIKVRCNVTRKESHKFYETLGFVSKKEQKVFER